MMPAVRRYTATCTHNHRMTTHHTRTCEPHQELLSCPSTVIQDPVSPWIAALLTKQFQRSTNASKIVFEDHNGSITGVIHTATPTALLLLCCC
jgi:hypothetical protein